MEAKNGFRWMVGILFGLGLLACVVFQYRLWQSDKQAAQQMEALSVQVGVLNTQVVALASPDLEKQAYSTAEKEKIWLRLQALEEKIDALPREIKAPQSDISESVLTELETKSMTFKEWCARAWQAVMRAVKVHKRSEEAALWRAEWSVEAEPYMLKGLIAQAKWAVLYASPVIYQRCLASLQEALAKIPMGNNKLTDLQEEVTALSKIPVQKHD
jgi:hypothetical protein